MLHKLPVSDMVIPQLSTLGCAPYKRGNHLSSYNTITIP